jgi:hypothetical protein
LECKKIIFCCSLIDWSWIQGILKKDCVVFFWMLELAFLKQEHPITLLCDN